MIGFGQQEKISELVAFLKNYQCEHNSTVTSEILLCCDDDKIKRLDSFNAIDWVQDSMWINDSVSYVKCCDNQANYFTHYTDYGDAQLFTLRK